MAGNKHRHTAGILALAFSVGALILAFLAREQRAERGNIEWIDYPTALGDPQLYSTLGEDDRYEPNLKFPAAPEGLYRRTLDPLTLADATMFRVDHESDGRYTIYQPAEAEEGIYFLKVAPDRYHSFGDRLHWPEYTPPGS